MNEILPAVAAIIFNEKGEVLLQRRADVDQWCIISGHVEFDETVEQAILREVLEETDTQGKVIRFIGVYSSPESQTYNYPDRTIQYVTSYFEVKLLSDVSADFHNNETKELRYFSPGSLPENMAQINPFWLSDAMNQQKSTFVR